ncbi:unnamed protein product [Sphagnum tenellum]
MACSAICFRETVSVLQSPNCCYIPKICSSPNLESSTGGFRNWMIPADSNTNKLKTACFKLFMTVCSMEGKSSDTTVGSLDLPQSDRRFSGQVLGPPPPDSDWWDRKLFSGPVVVRDSCTLDKTQSFRYRHLSGGAMMDPSPDSEAFDAVHLGVSDVLFDADGGDWHMYYFGGSFDELPIPGGPTDKKFRGVRLQPGLAMSKDGLSFEDRKGPILELGDADSWDKNGVSWPRVIPPKGGEDRKWFMTYHTRETEGPTGFGCYTPGIATSTDGENWVKGGKVLSLGAPGSWDEGGASVCHVLKIGDQFLMFYEGSDFKFQYAIGLAVSDDGIIWERDQNCGPEPGGPILRAQTGEDFWDNVLVGTPYVLAMEDGSFRMYYLGVGKFEGDKTSQRGIGLAISDGENYRSWRRFNE